MPRLTFYILWPLSFHPWLCDCEEEAGADDTAIDGVLVEQVLGIRSGYSTTVDRHGLTPSR